MFSPLARPHPVPYTRTHTLAFQPTRALSHTVRLHTHSHTHTRTLAHAYMWISALSPTVPAQYYFKLGAF